MRISEDWLRESVNPDINILELVDQLTMAGLEVEGVDLAAGDFDGVVVGEVLEVRPHPNADRLKVCQVCVGANEPLQIVCGAPNVYAGMRAPTALIGATLSGDFRIKKSKLRGEESFGMLCSQNELGLAEEAEGLMELPDDAPVGNDIREYLKLDDSIIEIDLTPNRADCLSVEGVAREVAVLNRLDWTPPGLTETTIAHQQALPIRINAPEACPRYLGRLIRGVDPIAKTPIWMKERLRRSGLRSLGPLIDVTNYVLLELGQPLHAFDYSKIDGEIVVRFACEQEKLLLLNDQEITLENDMLVIADKTKPLALAGIMGGSSSAVSDDTQDIFLECAFFSPTVIMGKSRRYGLHTDSSHRFERGVDPEIQRRAIERATELIVSIAGGRVGPVVEAEQANTLTQRQPIPLRAERAEKLLGVAFNDAEIEDILRRMGMCVEQQEGGWLVTPPSFRFDISIEADLIEELGRIYGYDKLPRSNLLMHVELGKDSEMKLSVDRLKDVLVDRDYQEAITFSFADENLLMELSPEHKPIPIENPISSGLSMMRTNLWAGLLLAAQWNMNHQQERIRFFENGLIFLKNGDEIQQNPRIAGLITGAAHSEQWMDKSRLVDFYDIKSDVESLLELTNKEYSFSPARHPALHPGQTAQVLSAGGEHIGWLGMLHPRLQKEIGFDSPIFLFELDCHGILDRCLPAFKARSKFPRVRRDLAVIVAESVSAGDLVETISDIKNNTLCEILIFDVYRGEGVESGKKSVALGLILQNEKATLTEQKIDAIVSKVLNQLTDKLGAKLRD